jgi:hypothetical protein
VEAYQTLPQKKTSTIERNGGVFVSATSGRKHRRLNRRCRSLLAYFSVCGLVVRTHTKQSLDDDSNCDAIGFGI